MASSYEIPVTWRPDGAERAFTLPRQVQCLNLAPSSEPAWGRPQLLSLEMPWDSCPGPPRDGGPGEGLVRLTLSADGSEGCGRGR